MTECSQNKSDPFCTRPIREGDAEQLRALYLLSLSLNKGGFVQDVSYHGCITDIAAGLIDAGGEMLALCDGDAICGFGAIKPLDENGAVELGNLHLHPDYQKRGLGRRLIEALLDCARSKAFEKVVLHVTVTQESAIALYKKLGFIQTGRKIYTVAGQDFDTLHMELVLG